MSDLLARITIDPEVLHGRPCIRGMRISVADVLALLSSGASRDEILQDYAYLDNEDINAALVFAAKQAEAVVEIVAPRWP